MPSYPYICDDTQEVQDVIASIHTDMPQTFTDDQDRIWRRDLQAQFGSLAIQVKEGMSTIQSAKLRRMKRHRTDGSVYKPGEALPASDSLPRRKVHEGTVVNRYGHRVVEYKDGGCSTMDGRPIIASESDGVRESDRTGYQRSTSSGKLNRPKGKRED